METEIQLQLQPSGNGYGGGWGACLPFLVDPNGKPYMIYGLLGLLVLLHDVSFIPFLLAWDIAMDRRLTIVAVMSASFWSVEIPLNFVTMVRTDGEAETFSFIAW
eukprot:2663355-Amphidinium_carterae.1